MHQKKHLAANSCYAKGSKSVSLTKDVGPCVSTSYKSVSFLVVPILIRKATTIVGLSGLSGGGSSFMLFERIKPLDLGELLGYITSMSYLQFQKLYTSAEQGLSSDTKTV